MTGTIIIRSGGSWLRFNKPCEIISADRIEHVQSALNKIEDRITGGLHAAGFISYEASPAFDSALKVIENRDFPLLWFGIYSQPEIMDTFTEPDSETGYSTGPWTPDISRGEYNDALDRIRGHITCGETYQVNYTFRMSSSFSGNAFSLFRDMVKTGAAPYSAFIDTGRFAVCSVSPELFFELDGNSITCRPMKGTVKRGLTTGSDTEASSWLVNSEKNRAENVMITDMIRNDLGRIALPGSVNVPSLFAAERYNDLWQMTSTVCAGTDSGLAGIIRALFPCASITGAPKVRTMGIIRSLEASPRGIYTGCIGYAAPGRRARFSVAIRTVTIDHENCSAVYGTGGGIVLDSTADDEYGEALLKAAAVARIRPEFRLFETILHTRSEGFTLLERHLARMEDSAEYFGFRFSRETVLDALRDALYEYSECGLRMRLLLDRDGSAEVDSVEIRETSCENRPYRACVAPLPVSSDNVFLYHKTTERSMYGNPVKQNPGFDDVLLYNERGEITEFTIGNFAARINGILVTPPVRCGLLAGTFRAEMIDTGKLKEEVVSIDQLQACDEVYMINSVRGWKRIHIC